MTADIAFAAQDIKSTPGAFTVANSVEFILKSVRAHFDGSGAAAGFTPLLVIKDPGGIIVAECPASPSAAAGGSVDASWFLGGGQTGGGGGGGPTGQAQVRVPIVTPDNSSFATPSMTTANGFTNTRIVFPFFYNGHDSSWTGTIPIPQNYASHPQLILQTVTQATTGVVRWFVSTSIVGAGASLDAAYTAETAQNITVPGTTLFRQDVTFNLSTAPVAGATMNVKVTRNGANVADTCTFPAAVWECIFQFVVA